MTSWYPQTRWHKNGNTYSAVIGGVSVEITRAGAATMGCHFWDVNLYRDGALIGWCDGWDRLADAKLVAEREASRHLHGLGPSRGFNL